MPYGQVDKLSKLVPQNPAAPVTLAAAIASEPKLQAYRDEDPVVARAFDIAQKLEGLTRHASTHAAGIVIADRPLSELVPLYRDPKSDMPVTQFNMKWVEPAGLVKFDFLGLTTPTVLDLAVKLVKRRGIDIDLSNLPLDDAKSYEMLVRSGYTLGEADLLRRAMGKKIRSEMLAQRDRFVSGAVAGGVERGQAEAIFELLERFADYGFNKSHAAAYALVAYQTAYMKANYPVEFLAASMTLDMGNTDKLSEFRAEAERLGIKVEPPSVNRSGVEFQVDGNTIFYALAG